MANPTISLINRAGQIQSLTDELSGSTIRVRLYTGTTLTATSVIGDLATNEVSGNGYPAGGYAATLNTVTYDVNDGRVEGLLNAITITPSGGNIVYRQAAITVNNGTEYIKTVLEWPADETLSDGITYQLICKINKGAQGSVVDITDS